MCGEGEFLQKVSSGLGRREERVPLWEGLAATAVWPHARPSPALGWFHAETPTLWSGSNLTVTYTMEQSRR